MADLEHYLERFRSDNAQQRRKTEEDEESSSIDIFKMRNQVSTARVFEEELILKANYEIRDTLSIKRYLLDEFKITGGAVLSAFYFPLKCLLNIIFIVYTFVQYGKDKENHYYTLTLIVATFEIAFVFVHSLATLEHMIQLSYESIPVSIDFSLVLISAGIDTIGRFSLFQYIPSTHAAAWNWQMKQEFLNFFRSKVSIIKKIKFVTFVILVPFFATIVSIPAIILKVRLVDFIVLKLVDNWTFSEYFLFVGFANQIASLGNSAVDPWPLFRFVLSGESGWLHTNPNQQACNNPDKKLRVAIMHGLRLRYEDYLICVCLYATFRHDHWNRLLRRFDNDDERGPSSPNTGGAIAESPMVPVESDSESTSKRRLPEIRRVQRRLPENRLVRV